jgi:hypothetical protein
MNIFQPVRWGLFLLAAVSDWRYVVWFSDDDFDKNLYIIDLTISGDYEDPDQHALAHDYKPPREPRWISRELYVEIQCMVLEQQLRDRVACAMQENRKDRKAEDLLKGLLQCATLDHKIQWLQDYKGRAVLSCSLCLKNDVELVYETWKDGRRKRFCEACCKKLSIGMPEIGRTQHKMLEHKHDRKW